MDGTPEAARPIGTPQAAEADPDRHPARLQQENELLAGELQALRRYVRDKVDQLLGVMGTVPLKPEELDDQHLLDLDPIGIVSDSFRQVLEHLNQTHQELQNAHDELKAVFDFTGVGILVLDRQQKVLAYNSTAHRILLGNHPNPEGKRCFEAICGRDAPRELCTFRKAVNTGGTARREGWVHSDRRYDVLATPMWDRSGELQQVVLVYQDITERDNSLKALEESEERYRDLCENAHDMIQSVADDGTFLYVNAAWKRTLGYDESDLESLKLQDLCTPASREHCREVLAKVLAGQSTGHVEVSLRAKDGSDVLLAGNVNANNSTTGQPSSVRGIFRDVTDQRKLEQETARAMKLESVGQLAGGIAHDFNNLLTAILSNISLARLGSTSGDALTRRLHEAEKATLRARDLTQQLLTFAKGGNPIRREAPVDQVVRDAVAFALTGSGVHCSPCIPGDLWTAELDVGQIAQVVHNLVINAHQALDGRGDVQVVCRNTQVTDTDSLPLPPGPYVCISVQDDGPGISPDVLPRIFDPYYTTKKDGTGLGLATAHAIVHKHGGHIGVRSTPGEGATFFVYLRATGRNRATGPTQSEQPPHGKGRILVMDDEEMILSVTVDLLEMLGYRAAAATDGRAALDLYAKAKAEGDPFDAIIMDLTIPGGMGGAQTIEELLQFDPSARAIVSSGYSNDPVMADYRSYGFLAVAEKPYRTETLARILQKALQP